MVQKLCFTSKCVFEIWVASVLAVKCSYLSASSNPGNCYIHKQFPEVFCHIYTARLFIFVWSYKKYQLCENLWNLHNCTPCWAKACRCNSEDGAVDRPTLLALRCIQNKNVSVAWHVPGLQKFNVRVKILERSGCGFSFSPFFLWLFLFSSLTTDFTNHSFSFF